jgi:tetratricopeptide (TPR) repeat protein
VLAKKYPDDPEIQTLYADAIMNCIPWEYWKRDGSPKALTVDAKTALESVIKKFPNHPGAHHFYIHLVEASPNPEQALKSAAFLEDAMPKAGHLVHMPSHIYVRVGEYEKANFSNTRAIKVDEEFLSESNDQGMYRVGYYPHNIDFLCFGAYMNGQSDVAVSQSNKLVNQIATLEKAMPALYDFFLPGPLITHIRFGRWNEILTLPLPNEKYLNATAMSRFARGLAFLRKGRIYEAKVEMKKLDSLNRLDTLKSLYASFNSAGQLSNVAFHILKGELLMKQNKSQEALMAFNSAVMAEDTMRYTEPPDWRLPARHFLGAAMLDAKRYAEAEKVFTEDLEKNPENGWSLHGLMQCQEKLGKNKEAAATALRFEKAWKNSDVKISSSRY